MFISNSQHKPPLRENKEEEYPLLLSTSPKEECEVYNHAYLSQEIILGEIDHHE
jgi:hypothetical protein